MAEQQQTATIEVETASAPAEVWEALTTDDGLAAWMGEGATIEPDVDGLIAMPDPVGGRARHGMVEAVRSGERLDFTWWPVDEPDDHSHVSIVLTPIGPGTRITVTESAIGSPVRGSSAYASANRSQARRQANAMWAWRATTMAVALSYHRMAV